MWQKIEILNYKNPSGIHKKRKILFVNEEKNNNKEEEYEYEEEDEGVDKSE